MHNNKEVEIAVGDSCVCCSLTSNMKKFLNLCQDGTNASMYFEFML